MSWLGMVLILFSGVNENWFSKYVTRLLKIAFEANLVHIFLKIAKPA